jgi:hypothetical protein
MSSGHERERGEREMSRERDELRAREREEREMSRGQGER